MMNTATVCHTTHCSQAGYFNIQTCTNTYMHTLLDTHGKTASNIVRTVIILIISVFVLIC
jgi:hypothetical protein